MNNSALITLDTSAQVNQSLMNVWKLRERSKMNAVERARKEVMMRRFAIASWIFLLVFATDVISFSYGAKSSQTPFLVFISPILLTIYFGIMSQFIFATYSKFGTALEFLSKYLNLNYGQIATLTFDQVKRAAEEELYRKIKELRELQKDARTLKSEADSLRVEIVAAHENFAQFALVDCHIEVYFRELP